MKKYVVLLIALSLVVIAINLFGQKKVLYNEGIYTGVGEGNHGEIKVEVITDKYKIKEIKILEQEETPGLCDIVYDKIPKSVLKANSSEVNVVAGASYTSQGLIDSIRDAVNKAKIDER